MKFFSQRNENLTFIVSWGHRAVNTESHFFDLAKQCSFEATNLQNDVKKMEGNEMSTLAGAGDLIPVSLYSFTRSK
jgi:hypothetical protein